MSSAPPPPLTPPPSPEPSSADTGILGGLTKFWDSLQGSSAPTRAPREPSLKARQQREKFSAFYEMPDTAGVPGAGQGGSSSEDEFLEKMATKDSDRPRGIYLHGDVGCGKTFLMDIFYECAPVLRKKRVHFHSFMLDVQRRIHRWKMTEKSDTNYDPIPPLAHAIASENKLLCFDEFQVTDISDAAILHRLLKYLLLKHNVVFVFTSNRPPSELYKNGINREIFLPCIDLIEKSLDVYDMDSQTDYRFLTKMAGHSYLTPITPEHNEKFEGFWEDLSRGDSVEEKLEHTGREVVVPQAAHGAARFTFNYLCKQPFGVADFLEIARCYHTVMISDIPRMTLLEKVEARRFINLVDALYEHQVRFLCTAEAPPAEIFSKGGEQPLSSGVEDWAINTGGENLAIHTGEEELFMFNRCVSRLIEMQSEEYLAKGHLKEEDYATKYNYTKKK